MDDKKKNMIIKKVKVNYNYPEDLKSHFITNAVIQQQPEYFILSFFESWATPIIGDTIEERKAQLEKVDHLDANCVARFVVTPERMRDIAKAINDNLERYEKVSKLELSFEESEK